MMRKLLMSLPLILGLILVGAHSMRNSPDDSVTDAGRVSRNEFRGLPTANSELCSLKPGSVYDGDTIRVFCGNEELRIRFCGIDAPEIDQPEGIASRDHLRELIALGGGDLYVIRVESDRYGRTVAELFTPTPDGGEIHLNTQMIIDGHAWNWTQYSQRCPNAQSYQVAESIARERGLYPPPGTPPWEHRRQYRRQMIH